MFFTRLLPPFPTFLTPHRATRVFVKGLPPSISEADFRRHFEKQGVVTDVRLLPKRRFGYIGYKTAEEAQHAIKYFNKTYIRTSKIGVEIAQTVGATIPSHNFSF
jgi:multiple RNA-binding domain-containing protein 1